MVTSLLIKAGSGVGFSFGVMQNLDRNGDTVH